MICKCGLELKWAGLFFLFFFFNHSMKYVTLLDMAKFYARLILHGTAWKATEFARLIGLDKLSACEHPLLARREDRISLLLINL